MAAWHTAADAPTGRSSIRSMGTPASMCHSAIYGLQMTRDFGLGWLGEGVPANSGRGELEKR
eukprot:7520115-Alexandrium_andersonii.AAC.1